jgi:hypothetical protein
MWEFLLGFLFARATGISRVIRAALVLLSIGVVIAGAIYFTVVVTAVQERSHGHNVHAHNSR